MDHTFCWLAGVFHGHFSDSNISLVEHVNVFCTAQACHKREEGRASLNFELRKSQYFKIVYVGGDKISPGNKKLQIYIAGNVERI
jgi:hypothetical protein